jgi:hypothetical protein
MHIDVASSTTTSTGRPAVATRRSTRRCTARALAVYIGVPTRSASKPSPLPVSSS